MNITKTKTAVKAFWDKKASADGEALAALQTLSKLEQERELVKRQRVEGKIGEAAYLDRMRELALKIEDARAAKSIREAIAGAALDGIEEQAAAI
ncbi:MAG: hypothetical protein CMM60_12435 [Rhodospirillaceae bacterium]|jgi:hypothetical protein|nr:hypothetical protein [Rhodospirillaceae bacterium]|tara:strand:- start:2135 stop:2419 length:285 start_codon:yes stop_codon:yes gene_type:complete